jgi:hypothetical protein
MNLEINDRETTVLLTALDLLRDSKQRAIIGDETAFKQVNQYDLLAPQHTLMHTLTLMSKLTKQPVEYFTRNPSQNPTPQTHEEPATKPSSTP